MSDATQDPTLDSPPAPQDDTEAAQTPEDPTAAPTPSQDTPAGQAKAEPAEQEAAPQAPLGAEPEAASEAAFEASFEAAPEAAPEASSNEGDAPAAKTEDHTAEFAASSETADEGSKADFEAPAAETEETDDSAQAQLAGSGSDEAPAEQDGVAGDGPTHGGTDTPEVLIQNPADPVTGKPIDGSGQPKGVVVGGSGSLNRPSLEMAGAFGTSGGDDSSLPNGSGEDGDKGDAYTGASDDDGDSAAGELITFIEEAFDELLDNLKSKLDNL